MRRMVLHNQGEELPFGRGGKNPDPGALALMVSTGASEPESFLTSRMSSATAIPEIQLIHLMGC